MTAVLLVLLWRVADGRDALVYLREADAGWLIFAGILLLAHTVFAALRWRVTAAPLGVDLTPRRAVSEYFLAQLGNATLPGGILGDAGRATRSRHDAGLGPAAGAIIVERMIGQAALLLVLALTFLITIVLPTGLVWPRPLDMAIGAFLSLTAVGVVILVVMVRRARGRAGSAMARALNGLRRSVASPGVAVVQIAYSVATTVCILGAFACCATAVGAPLALVAIGAIVPLVLLAMVLPISIGGWGVREGAAVALLPLAGLTSAQALATSVAFGIVALVAAVPGFVAVWFPGPQRAALSTPSRLPSPEESS
ncbi:lysylphosphatidylglycerol synthase transmembrane domain-containing protein [Microbacterium koreense]